MKFQPNQTPNGHETPKARRPIQWSMVLTACCLGFTLQTVHAETQSAQNIETGFYPYGGGEELTIKAVKSAKQSIFMAADSVISGSIAQALVDARKRGVNILAVLDKSQEKSGAKLLTHGGIQVHIDHKHVMRNNYMVIDGETVEIGRINYSEAAAKKSADNVLVLWNNPAFAKTYRANWQEHWDHSDPSR